MCGIIGYTGSLQAKDVLIRGLKRMEYRGYDSAGIAVQTPLGLNVKHKVGKVAGHGYRWHVRHWPYTLGDPW